MPNIWHLAHQTPKTNPHQVLRISNILPHCYSTVSNMRRYGHQCQKKFCLFYLLFSLLPTHISLSSSASSLHSGLHLSRCSLFLSHSHFFYLSLYSSLVLTLLRQLQATVVPPISPAAATHRSHPHSTPPHLADLSLSLSLFFDVWLFWLLVVGWFWLMVVGWSGCGCVIWDGFKIWDDLRSGCGCEICGCGWVSLALLSILVVVFFFFFGSSSSSGWYWWSVVDLWGLLVVVGCGDWSVGVGCCCWWW